MGSKYIGFVEVNRGKGELQNTLCSWHFKNFVLTNWYNRPHTSHHPSFWIWHKSFCKLPISIGWSTPEWVCFSQKPCILTTSTWGLLSAHVSFGYYCWTNCLDPSESCRHVAAQMGSLKQCYLRTCQLNVLVCGGVPILFYFVSHFPPDRLDYVYSDDGKSIPRRQK